MPQKQSTGYVMVGTKLQAAIVEQMVDCGLIRPPFHLIKLYAHDFYSSGCSLEYHCKKLTPLAKRTTCIARSRHGFPSLFFFFMFIQIKCRLFNRRLYVSNIDWYPFALALKLVPGLPIYTFDDGSANVQRRDTSYLSEAASRQRGLRATIAKLIFPKGPSYFVRSRIRRHCTIYPGMPNIVVGSKIDTLNIQWTNLIEDEDVELLPQNVRKIFLGTIYEDVKHTFSQPVSEHDIESAIRWADIYIPHPRDPASNLLPDVLKKYTAEAIIGHYSRFGTITVAHFNSSAAIPFRDESRVFLINLCHEAIQGTVQQDLPTEIS